MLSRQIASVRPLRATMAVARSAIVQHRTLHARVPPPAGPEYPSLVSSIDTSILVHICLGLVADLVA